MKTIVRSKIDGRPLRYFGRSCAVIERTGDGTIVGRCWHNLTEGDCCPRHGDVSAVMKLYRETGELTDEKTLPPRRMP